MTVYIGVDLHVRTQTVCWVDTADGEQHEITLDHQRNDVRAFYAQFAAPAVVGVEASGYSLWFHRLLEELGHHLLVGDALAIRQCARRRQKNDRRDARLLLDLLLHQEFPAIHIPAPAKSWRCCATVTAWCASAPCCATVCKPWRSAIACAWAPNYSPPVACSSSRLCP